MQALHDVRGQGPTSAHPRPTAPCEPCRSPSRSPFGLRPTSTSTSTTSSRAHSCSPHYEAGRRRHGRRVES
jgi:hypothetical protein